MNQLKEMEFGELMGRVANTKKKEVTRLMQTDLFKQKYDDFEQVRHTDENGVEFIYARDLHERLGYSTWQKFKVPIDRAKDSCKTSGHNELDHFNQVVKMITLAKGAKREIKDIKLTRYACYLIAMNGDPRKSEIAFAQNYFAAQTRKFERIVERMAQIERLDSKDKHTESEKEFNRVVYQRGAKEGFGRIKSKGDKAFLEDTIPRK